MRAMLAVSLCLVLCSCGIFDSDADRGYAFEKRFKSSTAFTTADIRIITERDQPLLANSVFCVEPAPDVTKAIATQLSLAASGGNGAATGSLTGAGSSAEAAAELAGRSTALLGLRDGLYRACEAYANGIIGQDAYGLVLARYSQIMTTLFLGQDIVGATGAEAKASISALIAATGGQQPAAAKPGTPSSTDGKSETTSSSVTKSRFQSNGPDPKQARVIPADWAITPVSASVPAGGVKAAASDTPSPAPASSGNSGAVAALSLTRMNEDYLHDGAFGVLLVACINDGDLTRYREKAMVPDDMSKLGKNKTPVSPEIQQTSNIWLHNLCSTITSPMQLASLANPVERTRLVNPEVAAAADSKPISAAPRVGGDPTIRAVQQALTKQKCQGCDPGTIDGVFGEKTRDAVKAYEHSKDLTENGDPFDEKFLTSLRIHVASAVGDRSATLQHL